ncbi:MAG: hypothetical protein E7H54_04975 [Clostridium perfringens]|uniref:hypothetical protein n=1 Tax=Clostridium perfringens TaxID=1502 RepID=UPI0024BCFD37|nr:hypothetical protein [Clostridium perfringens]MDU8988514.1 hypothetical protein [Clostridium perfringens]
MSGLDKLPSLSKGAVLDGFCTKCGNKGLLNEKCPVCGRIRKSNSNVQDNPISSLGIEIQADRKNKIIPTYYQNKVWDINIVKDDHRSKFDVDATFRGVLSTMQKVHDSFSKGLLPTKSLIIIAPQRMSKVTWAYSCMNQAYQHGLTVAPLLDSLEFKRLSVLSAENPKYKFNGVTDYDNYINADVLFLTIVKNEYCTEAFSVIIDLLDKRSRRGVPTFIISRFPIEVLSQRDYTNSFQDIVDYTGNNNDLKYPVIKKCRRE